MLLGLKAKKKQKSSNFLSTGFSYFIFKISENTQLTATTRTRTTKSIIITNNRAYYTGYCNALYFMTFRKQPAKRKPKKKIK